MAVGVDAAGSAWCRVLVVSDAITIEVGPFQGILREDVSVVAYPVVVRVVCFGRIEGTGVGVVTQAVAIRIKPFIRIVGEHVGITAVAVTIDVVVRIEWTRILVVWRAVEICIAFTPYEQSKRVLVATIDSADEHRFRNVALAKCVVAPGDDRLVLRDSHGMGEAGSDLSERRAQRAHCTGPDRSDPR